MNLIKYPDGSSYAKVPDFLNPNEIVKQMNSVFRVNNYEDLWYLHQFVDAMNSIGISPTVTIPCLIDAQADRRFAINESFGLKLVCEFLNKMDATFKIFHPHNPDIVEALMDNVEIIDNSEFITKVLLDGLIKDCPSILKGGINNNNLILMSSDAGGFKPLMKLCDKLNWQGETYSASKSRKYENGETTINQFIDRKDFNGKDILIVDDICVYGGTFKGLSEILKERNCGKLYLAISHITIRHLGEDPVTNYFDRVFTTNSKYQTYYSNEKPITNLQIINLF